MCVAVVHCSASSGDGYRIESTAATARYIPGIGFSSCSGRAATEKYETNIYKDLCKGFDTARQSGRVSTETIGQRCGTYICPNQYYFSSHFQDRPHIILIILIVILRTRIGLTKWSSDNGTYYRGNFQCHKNVKK